jgi:hypothetical protein
MTRLDDLGAAGWERGDGYQPERMTARGFAGLLLALAGCAALTWLLTRAVGERREQDIFQIGCWLFFGAMTVREILDPLRRDPFAEEGERRRARILAIAGLVAATAIVTASAAHLLVLARHGG